MSKTDITLVSNSSNHPLVVLKNRNNEIRIRRELPVCRSRAEKLFLNDLRAYHTWRTPYFDSSSKVKRFGIGPNLKEIKQNLAFKLW